MQSTEINPGEMVDVDEPASNFHGCWGRVEEVGDGWLMVRLRTKSPAMEGPWKFAVCELRVSSRGAV